MSEETKTEDEKSDDEKSEEPKAKAEEPKAEEPKAEERKLAPKPTRKPTPRTGTSWRPSWYRVGMGDLFIGIALLIAGTVVAMRTPTRWYGAFIVGTIETVHGLYLLSKKKQS